MNLVTISRFFSCFWHDAGSWQFRAENVSSVKHVNRRQTVHCGCSIAVLTCHLSFIFFIEFTGDGRLVAKYKRLSSEAGIVELEKTCTALAICSQTVCECKANKKKSPKNCSIGLQPLKSHSDHRFIHFQSVQKGLLNVIM